MGPRIILAALLLAFGLAIVFATLRHLNVHTSSVRTLDPFAIDVAAVECGAEPSQVSALLRATSI
jgi:hypothetical protein